MSDYESLPRAYLADSATTAALFRHRGRWTDFLENYRRRASDAASDGRNGLKSIAPELLRIIADERMLLSAWTHNAQRGGNSPGADGRRYRDYGYHEVRSLCKAVGDAIKSGTYRLGREKKCTIRKTHGTGARKLVLLTVVDRMVQCAAALALSPLFDPLFYPCSFGFRPKRGQLQALACAERNAFREDRFVWVCHDFRDAFGSVPIGRLMQLLSSYLPDPAILAFLGRAIASKSVPGLRQGAALSPLMLNLYAHHFVDRRLCDRSPESCWIRYGDDHLIQCRTLSEAGTAEQMLRRLLVPTGFRLKAPPNEAIVDLKGDGALDFLGFSISCDGYRLTKSLPARAWTSLRRRLESARTQEHSSLRAEAVVTGWLKSRGPAFEYADPSLDCGKVVRLATQLGFEEIPDVSYLSLQAQGAAKRWVKIANSGACDRHGPIVPRESRSL